jgi:hypothetical protein
LLSTIINWEKSMEATALLAGRLDDLETNNSKGTNHRTSFIFHLPLDYSVDLPN